MQDEPFTSSIKNPIIIITAPSGAGKTSITHHLLKKYPQLAFSISATTRDPRHNEKNKVDYYFITIDDFQQKIKEQAFIEWEMVYEGKYYGTLKQELERIWNEQKIPLLDIDVQGAIHVQQQYPKQTLSIFIDPPSIEELKKRLQSRGTETNETLEIRVNKAMYELSFKHHFNIVIKNDDFKNACTKTEESIKSFLH